MIDFNCSNDYILENDRVLLRPLEEDDYELLLPFALEEPDLWTYSLVSPAGAAGMQSYILQALNARTEGKEYPFIVYDKSVEQYAGCTRFYDIQLHNQSLQLGYTWYGKRFQRTGLNRHCKYLLLSFAFENMGMERIEFRADNNNVKSIAAMKSIGCTVEGVLRSNLPTYNGTRRDSIVLSILREEWFGRVKDELKSKMY
jgi:RimJ/RimL family protein N-acetyltransferase